MQAGRAGLVEMSEVPVLDMCLTDTTGDLLQKVIGEKGDPKT